jgi:hypothetical protein
MVQVERAGQVMGIREKEGKAIKTRNGRREERKGVRDEDTKETLSATRA